MDKQSRREAIREYKERRVSQGIFALRSSATGETWVGQSRDLEQKPNGVWSALRRGGHPNAALQAAFTKHGEAAFAFEVLETVDADGLSPYALANLLKNRDAHWRARLGAAKIVG